MRALRKLLVLILAMLAAGPWPAPAHAAPDEAAKPSSLLTVPLDPKASPGQQHSLSAKKLPIALDDVGAELLPAELYGAAYSGPDGVADLYRLDPTTGTGALIGSTGFERVSAMDFDASGRLLATGERNDGSNTSVLISIDLATGKGTEIGPTGVLATGFGNTLSDMSFRHADGTLYAYIEPGDGVGVIDPSTGVVTALGGSGTGSLGNGIAFRADDTLFQANEVRVNTLDQLTGVATGVAALVWSPPADSSPRVNAMDFHPSAGTLFASVQDDGGSERYLSTVDPASGVVSIIGPSPLGLDALAWRPARAVSTLPPLAPALYGSAFIGTNGLATLYRLDPSTGSAAFIGPIGFERVSAMDFDPYGTLYATGERADGTNTPVLLTIDVRTGRGTEVGPTGLPGFVFADIDFRRSDGRLYGYLEPFDEIAVIDPLTGLAAVLGPAFPPGCCGNGISFDAAGGRLYHANEAAVSLVDQTTGAVVPIAPLAYPPFMAPIPRVSGMDAHPATGELFASIRDNSGANWLGKLDPATGTVTGIGPTLVGLDAIAWGGIRCGVVDFEGIPDVTGIGKVGGAVSVTFGPEWVSLIDSDAPGGSGNFANEPSSSTIALHVAPSLPIELGSGVRFVRLHMVADPGSLPVSLQGYDGPGGSGNVVAFDIRSTIGVAPPAPCTGDPTGDYCLWDALTLHSPVDDIRSLVLNGSIPGFVGYDDLTWCQGPPDILYGASYDGPDGLADLHRIDPDTGAPTHVGPIGFQRVSAMDFDERGILYATGERNDGTNTSVLLTIDTATGAGTEVGPTGLASPDNFTDMSFRSNGRLFAYFEFADAVALIDPTTGAAAALGPFGFPSIGNGMAFDPGDNLFHANHAWFSLIDQTTGAGTFLGNLVWVPPADFSPRVNAMDFRPRTRTPYVSVNDTAGGPNPPENYLATVSFFTGAVDIIGPTADGLDAIAWLTTGRPPLPPEVSPPGALIPFTVGVANPAQLKVEWEPTIFADTYRLLVGDFAALRPMSGVVPGNAGSAQCGLIGTSHLIPMPAGNVFMVVVADNTTGTGPLGVGIPSLQQRQGDLICP